MAWSPTPEVAVARDAAARMADAIRIPVDRCVVLYTTDDGRIGYASFGRDKRLCATARKIGDTSYEAVCDAWSDIDGSIEIDEIRSNPEVLDEIVLERLRQDARWGQQDHPCTVDGSAHAAADYADARRGLTEAAARAGRLSWDLIAEEELAEAIAAPDEAARRAELVQLAAVVVAWIEAIDRRSAIRGGAT